MERTTKAVVLAATVMGLTGCNDEAGNDESFAEALSHVADAREQASAKVHAAEKMKALEKKAAASAEAARQKAWNDLITVPAQLPADLETACSELSDAFDAYQLARLTGTDLDRYKAVKQRDLEKIVERCHEAGSMELAACRTHALTNAPTTFTAEDAKHILSECEEKIIGESPKTAQAKGHGPVGAGSP